MPRIGTSLASIALAPRFPAAMRNPLRLLGLLVLFVAAPVGGRAAALGAESRTGQEIYQEECARCHGHTGEGTKKTTHPLAGEKSPGQLAKVILRTMPDDDPGSCSEDEARLVSGYIHNAFYSADAQARLHPQRVALSHLTVGQYRNAVADLIGGFRPVVKPDGRQGLHGEYFNSKELRNDKRLIERIDPEVNFDFGTTGPEATSAAGAAGNSGGDSGGAKFNPDQFCIRWEGSVFAAETGDYEFIVRTEQALRLWVNDPKTAVVDAMVKSGADTEYRASVFLIAGRSYPVRLEVYKGRELSDNNKKKKGPPVPTKASVALLWKVPGRQADELVPARCLSPVRASEVAVVRTPFPPDDRSYGWERGSTVSQEWVTATTDAAMDVAGYVSARLPELAGLGDDAKDRDGKLRAFCRSFAERAFRRPLTDAEKQQVVDRAFEGGGDPELAVKRVVIRVMISPEFLYPGAEGSTGSNASAGVADGYAAASRLALVLWDSLPDPALLAAAGAGTLATREDVARQAERMFDDPRARLKVRRSLLAWLRVDQSPELVKDPKKFPGFDPALASDLRTSLELSLDDVVSSQASDFRQLLTSDDLFLSGRLAKFYGADLPPSTDSTCSGQAVPGQPRSGQAGDAGFTKVKLEPGQRAGVLTHPYMLSTFAYPRESSPIHRGVFIIRGILGVTLRPPANAAFSPLAPELHPHLTTRERITMQTSQESCAVCHSVINPLGFPLEQFDAVGRRRETENEKPVDASGHYETRAGPDAHFNGARDLAAFLADSEETHDAFTQQMFQQLVKQPVRAYGLGEPRRLREAFAKSGYSIRKLVVEIAVTAAAPPPPRGVGPVP